jgi:TRAP-type C4-dicarboxylate transport system permease large subunit
MIVWGGVISTSIGAMYLAGIIPGLLIAIAQMATGACLCQDLQLPRLSARHAQGIFQSAWDSAPALFTPFIIVGGILLGWFTATESAADRGALRGRLVDLHLSRNEHEAAL